MSRTFDAIVIGAGQAGPFLAARLAEAGQSVALIERKYLGGTCVNAGCMPTKTMVASAYAVHMARRASDYGVTLGGSIGVDLKKVMDRKSKVTLDARQGLDDWLRPMKNCTLMSGHARFVSPHEIEVAGERFAAERIFLNVGGRASVPVMPGLDTVPFLTNSSILALDTLPKHLIVIGGSYIGLEFGQMFRRFGAQVTIVEKNPRLVPREDEDVSTTIADILAREGIGIRLNAACIGFEKRGQEIGVRVDCSESPPELVGSHVLLAIGRTPNTGDLGLEQAGVETDQRGYIRVDEKLQTTVPGIWALGDCNGRGAFTHTSYDDFEIVAANLLDGEDRRVSHRHPVYALYTDPPLGRIGMTEAEAQRRGRAVLVAKRPMTRVGRAVEKGETLGFMKVIADAETKALLGAAILGVGGDEAVQTMIDALYAATPVSALRQAVHIHPTVSELVPTILGALAPLEARA